MPAETLAALKDRAAFDVAGAPATVLRQARRVLPQEGDVHLCPLMRRHLPRVHRRLRLAALVLGVLARGFSERLAAEHRLDRTVDAVVAIDAIEVPLHHLRDGVFLLRIQAMQLWHRDVQQVLVDGIARRDGAPIDNALAVIKQGVTGALSRAGRR